MAPAEQSPRADLMSARFLSGEDWKRWQLKQLQWPFLCVNVVARDNREYTLRLDCTGFPNSAPTGTFWDLMTNIRLSFDKWPQGGERIQLAFKPGWKNGDALYIPCDRESLASLTVGCRSTLSSSGSRPRASRTTSRWSMNFFKTAIMSAPLLEAKSSSGLH